MSMIRIIQPNVPKDNEDDEGEEMTPEEEAESIATSLEIRRRLKAFMQPEHVPTEEEIARAYESRKLIEEGIYDELKEGLKSGAIKNTKSAQIRFLAQRGMLIKHIARFLNIRYQMVYQVATREGFSPVSDSAATCRVCGRLLTDPDHAKNGIGPICAGKST